MSDTLVVVLDCDGVILDSNSLKNRAFAHCLRHYPDDIVNPFLGLQQRSFGMSRYKLFEVFFSEFAKIDCSDAERARLLEEFSRFCFEGYPKCELTSGAKDTLEFLHQRKVPMYVASGSDEIELNAVLEEIGIAHYFVRIYGSPTSKSDNLQKVKTDSAPGSSFVFVGDSKADFNAATTADIPFVYLSTWAADREGMNALKATARFREERSLEFLKSYNPFTPRRQ